ncbi:MAG: ABC transporter permease [candidate division Zixibacteria bacterium]|nr:ABC transporter permease [candidate division Zixibacteria bacterium]
MFGTLISKELRSIFLSPKFSATFGVSALLLLLSVYIGIQEYRTAVRQYDTAMELAERDMEESSSWAQVEDQAYRKPDPMQIFVSGLSYDIGRWTEVSSHRSIKLKNSPYSDDPIFAVFRYVDFAFIVQIVLSLLAILFTYDAVNGEREQGTLRLVLSNAVPRARYLLAKCTGVWIGLVVPVLVPILLGLLMVIGFGVDLDSGHWSRILLLISVSLLYFTFFVVFGVFVSTLTKRSGVSFLLGLVVWVGFVLIIPRAGVMAAGQIANVPRLAEIEGLRDAYAADKWKTYMANLSDMWRDDGTYSDSEANEEEQEDAMWARIEAEDAARQEVQNDIEQYEGRLREDLEQRRRRQQRLAFTMSRISPAAAYQLAAQTLAGTGIDLKQRYEASLNTYRDAFTSYVSEKQKEAGMAGALTISISSEDGLQIGSRESTGLDISDRPHFEAPQYILRQQMAAVVIDFGLLALATLIMFAGSFVAFLRYDVH